MNRKTILFILLFTLLGGGLSLLLLFQHYSEAEANNLINMLCGGDSASGCEKVNHSSYSAFSGIPLAAIGIVYFLSIGLLAGFSMLGDIRTNAIAGKLLTLMTGASLIVDVLLLGVQIFSIGAFCILCISTYLTTFFILVLLLRSRHAFRDAKFRDLFRSVTARLVFTAWISASVMATISILALNYALSFKNSDILQERLTESAYSEYEQSPIQEIDLNGVPFRGDQNAAIKIVIFSDFLCPYCRQMAQYFEQYIPRWHDRVALYYKNYPLDQVCNVHQKETIHEGSCWIALGGICATQQGKFWLYHDYIYNKKIINPGHRDIIRFGKDLGMDTTSLAQCLFSVPLRNFLRTQIENGFSVGVSSTPRIYINGRLLPKLGYLQAILGMEAKRLGLTPLEGLNE